VLDIIEKKFRSDDIAVGLYGFRKASDFIAAYTRLNDKNYPMSKLYVSHLISYLIGYKERVFNCIPVLKYEDWGSGTAWTQVQRQYATFFVDYDVLFEKIGERSSCLERMIKSEAMGMRFVFFSTEEVKSSSKIKISLEDAGFQYAQIVYGCNHTRIKDIISTEDKLDDMIAGMQ